MSAKAVHVYIDGRVQGVWFRGWTAQQAGKLGLAGWVRNLRDGRVEAVFSGNTDHVDNMLALCRRGPPLAHVDNITVSDADTTAIVGFETRPTL